LGRQDDDDNVIANAPVRSGRRSGFTMRSDNLGQNPSDPLRVESSFRQAQIRFWNEMEQIEATKVKL
jgi:hypothetical protein